jgi:hypothetical protein
MLISNENFKLGIIPSLNPFSQDYKKFWREQKTRCIEGYWVGGKWMPGNLYFYINFWKIKLNKSKFSKTKILALPFLRDLEWDMAYNWAEARGFSGFEDDNEFSCNRILFYNPNEEPLPPSCLKSNSEPKTYIEAKVYLRKINTSLLGRPLYENEAKNMLMLGSRGFGKSFWVSGGVIGHQFLTDGAFSYQELKDNQLTTEVLVGAGDAKFSKDLLAKVSTGFEELPGGIMFAGKYYPCPLSKTYSGSWESGKTITAEYEIKTGGTWSKKGSFSKIQHRTFKDNPFAGNGTRPSIAVLEEIGFFNNLEPSHGALKECMNNGSIKFGSGMYLGTGGDMAGGGTIDAQKIFNNPEAYDMIGFEDVFENTGKRICYFVPAWMGLNEYKDSEGITDKESAMRFLLEERRKAAAADSKRPLNDELQNRPIVPSEAFLVTGGNVFPIAELRKQLGFIEACTDGNIVGTHGEMIINSSGKVEFIPDLKKKLKPCDYPMKDSEDTTGCWVIWEHPELHTSYGYYLAGTDPYDQDQAANSVSLGSTFIMKRATPGLSVRDQIVAEYTARPATAEGHHEIVRLGLLYYGALDLYENEKNTMKMHFDHKHTLHLLSSTPTILKATANSTVNRTYGIHMTTLIKEELEIYARDWLTTVVEEGKLNLHFIYSKPLLKELISYNDTGNFDRVIAFMLCICNRMQFANIISKRKEELKRDPFFSRRLFQ